MARGVRLKPATGRAWAVAALVVGLLALGTWPTPRDPLDWQPALFPTQPWRAVTAAFVHLSALHLEANLAGTLMVGLLGLAARVGAASVLAWFVAWPLTQVALLAEPELTHYAGLSGVLHAGVAVVAVHLLFDGRRAMKLLALALLGGLAVKVVLEAPWAGALRHPAGWDIAVAPLAHAAGAVAGAACSLVVELVARRARSRDVSP